MQLQECRRASDNGRVLSDDNSNKPQQGKATKHTKSIFGVLDVHTSELVCAQEFARHMAFTQCELTSISGQQDMTLLKYCMQSQTWDTVV